MSCHLHELIYKRYGKGIDKISKDLSHKGQITFVITTYCENTIGSAFVRLC